MLSRSVSSKDDFAISLPPERHMPWVTFPVIRDLLRKEPEGQYSGHLCSLRQFTQLVCSLGTSSVM